MFYLGTAAIKPEVKAFEKVSQQKIEEAKRKDDTEQILSKSSKDKLTVENSTEEDDDDELIGPLPPGFRERENTKNSTNTITNTKEIVNKKQQNEDN